MAHANMTLVDWLDDLCVRFIVNLPNEELQSVERICFQIEEAQWFYEDFIRPLDPNNLPSMHLRKFSQLMFQHCPLFSAYSEELHQQAYEQFLAYKTRVPVRGAIMLNQDMTHLVLVKGWKKGAKWSFPRGKINKEETDLDCAVREVWEETGYDLNEAGLVLPDEQMKHITVVMREQNMRLYVFRGVPMDTYFEPRTRKEISKIDWYRLTDLPAMRRKNQVQQHTPGQDVLKESSFYMVAPFLQPLKAWIKQQYRLDRQRPRSSAHLAAPPAAITDDEQLQTDQYESIAEEAVPASTAQPGDSFANLIAQLGANVRPEEALPELSQQAEVQRHASDPAAELKRLLSVGMGVQSPPVEAPNNSATGPQTQASSLLALFKPANGQFPPRTPFEQMMSPPVQPSSPHGQHQPRPPQAHDMPPPHFPYSPRGQGHYQGSHPHFNGMSPPQMPPPFMHMPQHSNPNYPPPQPSMQQAFDARNPRPYHTDMDSQFSGDQRRPVIPSASNLPTPKLNSHTLGLLNSFRISDSSPIPTPSLATPSRAQQQRQSQVSGPQNNAALYHSDDILPSPAPYTMSPPQYKSPLVSASFEPEQPKPRTIHQDSLLTLFRGTSPLASPEPAELSAHPLTPGFMSARPVEASTQPDPKLLQVFSKLPAKTNSTSATVSGPTNAPDFDTMKRHSIPVSGSSRGPSPASQKPFQPQQILQRPKASPISQAPSKIPPTAGQKVPTPTPAHGSGQQKAFATQILKRPQQQQTEGNVPPARSAAQSQGLLDMLKGPSPQPTLTEPTQSMQPSRSPVPSAHARGLLDMFKGTSPQPPSAPSNVPLEPSRSPAPTAHTQGLLDIFKSVSPQPMAGQAAMSRQSSLSPATVVPPATQGRQGSIPADQKSTLLSLFSKPSPNTQNAVPLPQVHSPYPPTPKTAMSGIISPISPLPTNGSQAPSPANPDSRSRISSIGDATAPGIVIPPMSQPADGAQTYSAGGLSASQVRDRSDGKSPVDKTFLLGFLEDVARRGR